MGRSFKAGAVYFLLLYVIGFLLGATRELLLAPRLGVAVASAIEALPMLAAAAGVGAAIAFVGDQPDCVVRRHGSERGCRITAGAVPNPVCSGSRGETGPLPSFRSRAG